MHNTEQNLVRKSKKLSKILPDLALKMSIPTNWPSGQAPWPWQNYGPMQAYTGMYMNTAYQNETTANKQGEQQFYSWDQVQKILNQQFVNSMGQQKQLANQANQPQQQVQHEKVNMNLFNDNNLGSTPKCSRHNYYEIDRANMYKNNNRQEMSSQKRREIQNDNRKNGREHSLNNRRDLDLSNANEIGTDLNSNNNFDSNLKLNFDSNSNLNLNLNSNSNSNLNKNASVIFDEDEINEGEKTVRENDWQKTKADNKREKQAKNIVNKAHNSQNPKEKNPQFSAYSIKYTSTFT